MYLTLQLMITEGAPKVALKVLHKDVQEGAFAVVPNILL